MRQNEESFLEGILNGFEHFGGVPRKLIFDNAAVFLKAAPVKKTIPKPLYEFILKLDKPKEIIRILRCYLGDPNAAMKAIPAANYREFIMRYELVTDKEIPPATVCGSVNIPVSPPQLDPYDALLRKGVI